MSACYRTSILEYISVALVWSHCVPFLMSSFSKVRVTANADNYMNHWNCINYLLTKRLSVQRTDSFAWTHCFLGCQASFNSIRTLLPCYLLSVSQTIFSITCKKIKIKIEEFNNSYWNTKFIVLKCYASNAGSFGCTLLPLEQKISHLKTVWSFSYFIKSGSTASTTIITSYRWQFCFPSLN